MTFVHLGYLFFFFPMVLTLYQMFRTTAFANFVILGASYYFYGSSGIFLLIPLMISSLVDFYVGHKLDESTNERYRKYLLIFSIVVNMGILVFFKYATWFMQSVNLGFQYFHIPYSIPIIDIPLLPGVSFYTFQTMSYTIDIYKREMKASRNVVNYMAFVTFWPHLVAGPIMRAKNLLQQLETTRPTVKADIARYALLLIGWGLFKKIVLADNFGYLVEMIEGQMHNGGFPGAGLLFSYAFAGQIYCDFSAYTTIARGCSKFIGVELVRNFHTPYFSATPSEFWRRWHISLSSWLRDYVYIPLGGNRNGLIMQCRNFMITMFLGGLWHGAGILFIAWGLWHGFLLMLYRLVPIEQAIRKLGKFGHVFLILIMFHLTCFGWLLFRSNVNTFMPLWHTITTMHFSALNNPLFHFYGMGIAMLAGIVFITDYLGYRKDSEFEDLLVKFGPTAAVILMLFCYFAIMLLGKREGAQFVYFQF